MLISALNLILYPTFHNVIVKYSITWHISKKKILGAIRPTIHIFTYILLHFYSIYTEHSKAMHTLFLREHFSGEIARKCMVCYTKRVHLYGCLYRFMSPIKCRCRPNRLCISIVHCQPPTGNGKEREVLSIVYALHYMYTIVVDSDS